MLDWPGRIASTVFFAGCNFRCPFCHNAELVVNPERYEDIDPDELLNYLKSRRLWVENIVITGGEPTLAPGLENFLRTLKQEGFNVKLDTNGSRPSVLLRLIETGLVDYVAMDYKAPMRKYSLAAGLPVDIKRIEESISILSGSGIDHEFRLTVVPGLLEVEDLVAAARELSDRGAKKIYLQQFKNEITLDPDFSKRTPMPGSLLEDAAHRISQFMEVELRGV